MKYLGKIIDTKDLTTKEYVDAGLGGKANSSHTQTVSTISDLTATANELNVLDGITANTTELNYTDGVTSNIQSQLNSKQTLTNKLTAETALADGDYIPFYDTSATAHRKTLWSNIKSVFKTYFDTLYSAISHTHTVSSITDLTATASELNTLDGITATVTELNYTDGVSGNIQTQLNSKLSTVGTAASATKLATARTISLTGDVTGSASFDGSVNASITTIVADNSHNHIASNISNFDTEVSNNTDVAGNTSARHTHSNKAVLDATTASYVIDEQTKLAGIEANANNYSLPVASSTALGGVKSGTDITVDASGNVSVNDDSHNHIISNVDGLQTVLDNKLQNMGKSSGSLQLGRTFYNVANFELSGTPIEIVIKTKIPYTSGLLMPYIHLHGYAYGQSAPIELKVAFYIYNDAFCNYGAVSLGSWQPTIKLFSYVDGESTYVAVALVGSIYFPRFSVNMFDMWRGTTRDYSQGWTVVSTTTTPSIVGTNNLVTIPYKPTFSQAISLIGDVTGSATFNGVSGTSITATVADNSHNHTVSNITGLTASVTELNYTDGVTSNIQTQLNKKNSIIPLSATQPSSPSIGDYWYKIIT